MGLRPTEGNEKRLGSTTALNLTVALSFVIPRRTRISYFTALTAATYVVLLKENHMQLTEVAILDRKSVGAEGSAVLRTLPGNACVSEYATALMLSIRARL